MSLFDSFRATRWVRTLNLVLQAVLFLTLCLGLNYLARNHAWRYDITKHRRFSLSAETLSWIQQLKFPVKIYATLSDESENPEVRGLLNEYVHATEGRDSGQITVEYLDVYQNRGKADRLGIDQADVIMLVCDDKRRVLTLNELYRIEKGVRTGFQGEQAITAAVLDVSSPTRKKIYFLTGHAELSPKDTDPVRGLSIVGDQLRARNFEVDLLDINIARQVPDDASLLIAVWPQSRFSSREQELLRQYLTVKAGRLMLFLHPGQPSYGLDDLLLEWGVVVDNDFICDTGPANLSEDGDLIVAAYDPDHPITRVMLDNAFKLYMGPSRSVWPVTSAAGSGLSSTTLAATSLTAWGEVSYGEINRRLPEYNPGVDIKARRGMLPPDRLGLIVASERVAVRDGLPFTVPRGKLVVFGTGDLIGNTRIVQGGSYNIFLSAVNWTVDRDTQLNIPARPIEQFQLSLSAGDFTKLRYSLLLVLPSGVALLGLLVYWNRRS
ncbi:MAG TPA: GldG family protein [Opitutaceae bacterium]|nr:GldG family protein [Opitutaceae bacterium]